MTDSNWWETLTDPSEDVDYIKATKLANVLRRHPGDEQTKIDWCLNNLAYLEACADREGAMEARRRSGAIVSHAIAKYQIWWRSRGREMPQQKGPRSGTLELLRPVGGKGGTG